MKSAKKKEDSTWSWFDQNLDTVTRTIYMGSITKTYDDDESGVDNLMAEYFIKGMHILETANPKKEISVIMNNPGGDWYHGMAIYDSIMYSVCPTIIKVYGHAMSMGSVILQAADHRIMMPNSRFMIHYGYDGKYGHSKIFERWSDEGKRINYQMENIYLDAIVTKDNDQNPEVLERILSDIVNKQKSLEFPPQEIVSLKFNRKNSTLRKEEIRKVLKELLNFDTIMTPQETVDLGLADEIFSLC
jgi:ATP-dependent Clp endopeptidase proteolytic subunit ClpP